VNLVSAKQQSQKGLLNKLSTVMCLQALSRVSILDTFNAEAECLEFISKVDWLKEQKNLQFVNSIRSVPRSVARSARHARFWHAESVVPNNV
jgi:hypothetical protein